MNCKNCGRLLNDSDCFCPTCGCPVQKPDIAPILPDTNDNNTTNGIDTTDVQASDGFDSSQEADKTATYVKSNDGENSADVSGQGPAQSGVNSGESPLTSDGGYTTDLPYDLFASNGNGASMGAGVYSTGDSYPVGSSDDNSPFAAPYVSAAMPMANYPPPVLKTKNVGLRIGIIILAVLLAFSAVFGWYAYSVNTLHQQLLRDWGVTSQGTFGAYSLILDFSDETLNYNYDCDFDWLDSTLVTYSYKVISPSRVRFVRNGISTTVKVTFNSDHSQMTFTPALTSKKPYEVWYNTY